MAHARRKFDEIKDFYPDICKIILDLFSSIYFIDKQCREQNLSANDRLDYHQEHSASVMSKLYRYIENLYDNVVEPSSSIGNAIKYTLNRWKNFKKLLEKPGVPLDNNICEAALKKPIRNRKNAYFYRSFDGCRVADVFMSLIYSCELNGTNALHYIESVLGNLGEMLKAPELWLPWNYKKMLGPNTG